MLCLKGENCNYVLECDFFWYLDGYVFGVLCKILMIGEELDDYDIPNSILVIGEI